MLNDRYIICYLRHIYLLRNIFVSVNIRYTPNRYCVNSYKDI